MDQSTQVLATLHDSASDHAQHLSIINKTIAFLQYFLQYPKQAEALKTLAPHITIDFHTPIGGVTMDIQDPLRNESVFEVAANIKVNPGKLIKFMTIFEDNLREFHNTAPECYAYGPDQIPDVVSRFRAKLACGGARTVMHKTQAMVKTCSDLQIPNTARAIDQYIEWVKS